MKNFIIAKNLSRLISRACGFIYFTYILVIAFMRAANLEALSADDIALISMYGAIVGILFIIDYSIKIVYSAFKRQNERTA